MHKRFFFLALVVAANLAAQQNANVVKGYNKASGFKPEPKVLAPDQAWTNPNFYRKNNNWRESIYSGDQAQMVVMTINQQTNPKNEVPNEIHDFDQFIIIQEGTALISFNKGSYQEVAKGGWILAPAYVEHHIKNKSATDSLKLLSFYTKWDTKEPTVAYKTLAEEESKS